MDQTTAQNELDMLEGLLHRIADRYELTVDELINPLGLEILSDVDLDQVKQILKRQGELIDITHPHLKNVALFPQELNHDTN